MIRTLLSLIMTITVVVACAQSNQKVYLFAGTYTAGKPDKGIYVYEFNAENGSLKLISHTDKVTNPSFLSLSSDGRFLYACTETKMPNAGSISAFAFDSKKGVLSSLNKQPAGGENPVYVSIHDTDQYVVSANYTGGSISVFKTSIDGSLSSPIQTIQFADSSINKKRQEKSHVHAAVFSPDFKHVFFPDLGADKIRAFRVEPDASQPLISTDSLTVKSVPGSGPRHFTFHPNQKYAYCIEELSGTISVYQYNNGHLDSIQRIFSYSKEQPEYGGADIHISPDGLFLYATNRGSEENTIVIFSVDPINGFLTLVGHQSTYGDHPRNFAIDPSGNYLLVANQNSNNIVVFKRDLKAGLLTRVGKDINVPQPSCLKMQVYSTN